MKWILGFIIFWASPGFASQPVVFPVLPIKKLGLGAAMAYHPSPSFSIYCLFDKDLSLIPMTAIYQETQPVDQRFLLQIVQNGNGGSGGGKHAEEHFLRVKALPVKILVWGNRWHFV
jgi:hypothetical protein